MRASDIHPAFGVEITGLDLTDELRPDARAVVRRTFDQRSLLLVRGAGLDVLDQDRFCRMLIDDQGPGMASRRAPMLVSNTEPGGYAPWGRLLFHADMMWAPEPFQVLSLYAMTADPGAATTTFASGTRAWERLPRQLRRQIDGLHVEHVTGQVYSRGGGDLLVPERTVAQSTVTRIVRTHPRTGRPILYVSEQMTSRVVELPDDESEALLQELFDVLYDPTEVYEHTWQVGDLVVFDNLALQHARGNVLADGPARTLRKVIAPVPEMAAEVPIFARPD